MKMTGAIFDMDGTLLDSMPIWDRVGIDYLAGLGIQARPDLPERLLTMSMRQAAAYFRSGYGVNLPEAEIMDGINARIEAFYRKTAPAKEGVRDFLHALRQSGVKMCVATATDRPLAEAALRRTGCSAIFPSFSPAQRRASARTVRIFLYWHRKNWAHRGNRRWSLRMRSMRCRPQSGRGSPLRPFTTHLQADQEQIRQLADVYMPLFPGAEEALL